MIFDQPVLSLDLDLIWDRPTKSGDFVNKVGLEWFNRAKWRSRESLGLLRYRVLFVGF